MKTESGYEIVPGRAWGSNTKVSLVISGPDDSHETVVDDWRTLLRAMSASVKRGGWSAGQASAKIAMTEANVRALEDEIRALAVG